MDLYDIRARALPSPLNRREISQLFRFGDIGSRTRCKPVGEAKWQTIDELFPLLKYEAGIRYETREELNRTPNSRRIVVAGAVFLVGAAIFFSSRNERTEVLQVSSKVAVSGPNETLPENGQQTSSNAEPSRRGARIPGSASLETRAIATRR